MSATELVVRRRLSAAQQERRDRILAVARELAAAGGYDAVVMRDVAERSGVALGTLYRYFASKDHLLAEVLVAWGGQLEEGSTPLPGAGLGARPHHRRVATSGAYRRTRPRAGGGGDSGACCRATPPSPMCRAASPR